MPRSLIVMPDDTAKPILDAIAAAKKSIRVKMFIFSDPGLVQALIAAHKRGVKVRVMLNPKRRDGESENEKTRKALGDAGIEVADSNPAFDVTHEKSMVVDDATAFVKSLNWEPKNLTETRDYAVVTDQAQEVSEVMECFDADWAHKDFPMDGKHLIWCKGNGRDRIAAFIDAARHSLFLQNERYQDPIILEHLVRAKERGVKVHVMARPPHTLKAGKLEEGVGALRTMHDVGIKVHQLKHIKLHGKILLSDGARAIIGSINLAPGSFDSRRELAIQVEDPHILTRLNEVVQRDWEKSHPIDLTDKGLQAALEKHNKAGADLALKAGVRGGT
jgi:cardiolipin synthase A/B